MIIDVHTHIGINPEDGHRTTALDLLSVMKKAGVTHALVLAVEFGKSGGMIKTEELIEELNPYPNLFAIGTVSPFSVTKEKLSWIEGLLQKNVLRGIKLYLGYEHFYPNDERLWPLYELCSSLGKPIIYHTGFLWDPGKVGLAKYAHPLAIDDVASRFPELKILIAHMGNPWFADCAVVLNKNENVYADVSGYFKEHETIQGKSIQDFIRDVNWLAENGGSYRKLLFGSDWGLYDLKEYVNAAQSLPIPQEDKEWFFGKTAASLFGLPV